jgi:hypothetical protein
MLQSDALFFSCVRLVTRVVRSSGVHGLDHWSTHLEADVLSGEIVRENGYGGGIVGAERTAVGAEVARPVVPLHHRHVAPGALERDVRLRRRHQHLLPAHMCICLNQLAYNKEVKEDSTHGRGAC